MHVFAIVLVVLLLAIGIIWVKRTEAREQSSVEKRQGGYVVKVAGSRRGRPYHMPQCNKCNGAIVMTLKQAQQSGYNRCQFCGGRPAFKSTE